MNKICKVCRLEQPNHKMSCKDSNKEYVIPTAEEFLENTEGNVYESATRQEGYDKDQTEDLLIKFTNLHLDNAIKEHSEYLFKCSINKKYSLTHTEWLKDYKLRNKLN